MCQLCVHQDMKHLRSLESTQELELLEAYKQINKNRKKISMLFTGLGLL